MKVLIKTKKLLTNGQFLDIFIKSNSDAKNKDKILNFCSNSFDSEKSQLLKSELLKFDLKEFEIINLINIRPKSLIHLQLVIEEMSERLSEEQMNEILNLFKEIKNSKHI